MYEIWTSRNNLKYDKIQMTQETIITKIITHLHNIITTHYKLHKLNNMLLLFQENFLYKQCYGNNTKWKTSNNKLNIK